MSDYYISPEFKESLSSMIQTISEKRNFIVRLHSNIKEAKQYSERMKNQLKELDNSRKLNLKHKTQLKYQIRQTEIHLAFYLHDWAQISRTQAEHALGYKPEI